MTPAPETKRKPSKPSRAAVTRIPASTKLLRKLLGVLDDRTANQHVRDEARACSFCGTSGRRADGSWLDPQPSISGVMGPGDKPTKPDPSWQQIVTAVAAAAGGAAWVSAVGSGVVALRLRQADLPIEPVVALMSTVHRFAIGAGILTGPLLAGFIAFLADWALVPTEVSEGGRDLRPRQGLAAVTILGGGALVYLILRPPLETLAFESAAVVFAVVITLEVLHQMGVKRHRFAERVAIFLSVLVAAGAGAILAEAFGAPSFDEAEITIRDRPVQVTGGYITTTEHSVVLSTRCEVVEAVPRDEIARISVGPDDVTRTQC
jgi:hypothetical protein